MRPLSLLSRRPLGPALLALLLLVALPACSGTEETARDVGDAAEDTADQTADVAEDVADETMDVAEDAADAVTDAAGTVWNAVTDVFDDDPDADAAALVRPTSAGSGEGTVRFYEAGDGARLAVSLRGLDPGMHGIHIHQNASCADADTDGDGQMEAAGAAGGHWDPMNTNDHGAPTDALSDKHVGDLGNIEVGSDGTVETSFAIDNLSSSEFDITDHALVVHSGRDDLETDPSGESGMRVGCGIIEGR